MGHFANDVWHFLALQNWPMILFFGWISFVAGSIVTRRVMAPEFCPRCQRHNAWVRGMKADSDSRRKEK